jgi:7,8-dihydro-6-hydroxymethylpterin-pyrophosphokinase
VQKTNKLELPRPELRNRDFVLNPLKDLDAELIDPVSCQTVSELLNNINPGNQSIKSTIKLKIGDKI